MTEDMREVVARLTQRLERRRRVAREQAGRLAVAERESDEREQLDRATVEVSFRDLEAALPQLSASGEGEPIPMILHCPKCGVQHIDAPDRAPPGAIGDLWMDDAWLNPPHRSHLCHGCGHTWRPADVPTLGVASIATSGRADSPRVDPHATLSAAGALNAELVEALEDARAGLVVGVAFAGRDGLPELSAELAKYEARARAALARAQAQGGGNG